MGCHISFVAGRLNCTALVLSIIGALVTGGCRTSDPASASFASVNISGKSPQEICQTTAAVFQENGYQVGSLTPSNMVFQKEASQGQSLAYGGVVDTHYGSKTAVRVKALVVDLGAGTYRLQCKAYMVRNAGESIFEDESPLMNFRSGPYQTLLDKVAQRLK
jgi:hypothetical protein